jgi:phage terminase large subunit GpA-like protein
MKSYWREHVDTWRPPEEITVSQCADQHRVLGRGSSKPGPWETSHVPFMRDVMDAFSIDCVEEIWLIKPTQSGGTESILNMLLYAILQDPGPAMIVEPTENLADEVSRDRIDAMIEGCEHLKEVKTSDPDDLTKRKKTFSTMALYLAWSNSPSSLASRPIRYALFDEVNKYAKFSGEEANPLSLGKERTNTFIFTRKLIYISTPTTDAGYITRGEESCEARFRYHVPCPHCGHRQVLIFEQVQFSEFKDDVKKVEEFSFYGCEDCKGKIFNDAKTAMVRNGRWIDLNSGLEFAECIRQIRPKRLGFQINRLYSPWHTFGMVAREFLESKDYPEKLMNWRNSWMAESWVERYETKSEKEILENTVDIEPFTCPLGTIALTAGIDPSADGFWIVLLAWRRDMSCHLISYDFLDSWDQLKTLIFEAAFPVEGSENQLSIWRAVLDTGGGQREQDDWSMTETAYDWLRKNGRNRCFGAKGMSHPSTQKIQIVRIDKTPQGQPMPGGITLLLVDTSRFKDAIHYRLAIKEGDPGRFTFHKESGSDYVSHLLAEERRRNFKTGQTTWFRIRKGNHWFDATVLAFAAADPEFGGGLRIVRTPPTSKEEVVESQPINPITGRPRGEWMGGWGRRI